MSYDSAGVPARELAELLPRLAAFIPGGLASPARAQRLVEVFSPKTPPADSPTFLQLLDAWDGTVYFLNFWSAISEASDLVAGCLPGQRLVTSESCAKVAEARFEEELETFRDALLGLMHLTPPTGNIAALSAAGAARSTNASCRSPCSDLGAAPEFSISSLKQVLKELQSASVFPAFWRDTEIALTEQSTGKAESLSVEVTLEHVSLFLLRLASDATSCLRKLHVAAVSPHSLQVADGGVLRAPPGCLRQSTSIRSACRPTLSRSTPIREGKLLPHRNRCVELTGACQGHSLGALSTPLPQDDGNAEGFVFLHVYDVSRDESVGRMNMILAHVSSPIKLGGVFHTGVEVGGLEWSFGSPQVTAGPGVRCTWPRRHPAHNFRETIPLGRTDRSIEEIIAIVLDLQDAFPGHAYDVLRCNCGHFAEDFCKRLNVTDIPAWVCRLARVGESAEGMMQAVLNAAGSLTKSASLTSESFVGACPDDRSATQMGTCDSDTLVPVTGVDGEVRPSPDGVHQSLVAAKCSLHPCPPPFTMGRPVEEGILFDCPPTEESIPWMPRSNDACFGVSRGMLQLT